MSYEAVWEASNRMYNRHPLYTEVTWSHWIRWGLIYQKANDAYLPYPYRIKIYREQSHTYRVNVQMYCLTTQLVERWAKVRSMKGTGGDKSWKWPWKNPFFILVHYWLSLSELPFPSGMCKVINANQVIQIIDVFQLQSSSWLFPG